MPEAAIDREKQNALTRARTQPPKAADFSHVPAQGHAGNYVGDTGKQDALNSSRLQPPQTKNPARPAVYGQTNYKGIPRHSAQDVRSDMESPKAADFSHVPSGGQADGHGENTEKQGPKKDWRMGHYLPDSRYKDEPAEKKEEEHAPKNEKLGGNLPTNNRGGASEQPHATDHVSRLDQARSQPQKSDAQKNVDAAKDLAQAATPMGAFSLAKQINFIGDMPFVAALGAAILQGIIALTTFATLILPMIASGLCGIFIFMMLLLVGGNSKKKGAGLLTQKILVLIGGSVVGSILPFEQVLTVLAIYLMTLSERKHSQDVPQQPSSNTNENAAADNYTRAADNYTKEDSAEKLAA